jgi:hypothetical protein
MSGDGIFAEQLSRMFEVARRKAGFPDTRLELSTQHFRRPSGPQLELFS